jgi:hypothetical protein
MAITGKVALDDSVFAELVESRMVQELRPAMTSREFIRFGTKGPSTVKSFPLWTDPGAAPAAIADTTDISSTTLADTQQSATAQEIGFRVDISDLIRETHPSNLYSEAGGMVGRSVAEKWETDVADLMDGFSNVTTAASTLTTTDLLAAMSALEQRDIPGPYVGYLDPKQTGELRQEIATTSASYEVGRPDGSLVRPFGDSGFFGTYMGLPIWQTSLVITTAGLAGGAVFNSEDALGAYELWGNRLETQRDASARTLEFVGTQCYGLVEIDDTRGQTVKSAA